MKRDKVIFGVFLLILTITAIWSMIVYINNANTEEQYTISVIVNDSNNDRWIAMREGLEQAAKDYHFELNYGSTGEIASFEEEVMLIRRELERGADGLIIQMIDANISSEEMKQITNSIPVVLIETDIIPEELFTYVGPDNRAMGCSIAEKIEQSVPLEGKKIGILSGDQKQVSMKQRLEGCRSVLERADADILWIMQREEFSDRVDIDENWSAAPVDIIISLGNDETELAVDYFLNSGTDDRCLIYGIGRSEKTVYYLDKGVVQSLAVPNEFNMGYQSIAAMAEQLNEKKERIDNYTVDFLIVNRENLYDRENQKVLFPIVQ